MVKMGAKPFKAATVSPSIMAPGGGVPATAQADMMQAQPKGPGGGGFLSNPGAYSDSHAAKPPAARGAKKSAGYPNFAQNP